MTQENPVTQDQAVPRVWHAGDPCPDTLMQVRDAGGAIWSRRADDRWTTPSADGMAVAGWPPLLVSHGPVTLASAIWPLAVDPDEDSEEELDLALLRTLVGPRNDLPFGVWAEQTMRRILTRMEQLGDAIAAQAPAASEQPRCTRVDEQGRRCLETGTDRHVHVHDLASWNVLHHPGRPAASGDTTEQAAVVLHESGCEDDCPGNCVEDARKLAARGLLADGSDRARIEKALALHEREEFGGPAFICRECSENSPVVKWPCPTVDALTATEEPTAASETAPTSEECGDV